MKTWGSLKAVDQMSLVFKSLVWSGYWVPMSANQDWDWLASPWKPKITEPDWYRLVMHGSSQLFVVIYPVVTGQG